MKKKVWLGIGVISLIIIMVGVSVYRNVFAKGPSVKVAEVKTEEIASVIMIPGTLKLQEEQAIYVSPEKGEIKEILVKEGQQVKNGDILAKLENAQLELEVEQNKLSVESGYLRINQIDKQKEQLNGKKDELSKQFGNKEAEKQLAPEYDQLDVEKRMANLELKQTLLQKDLLEERMKELEIKSLYDGTVLTINEENNTNGLTNQEPVIVVGSLDKMVATGFLSEYDALKVKKGQKVLLQSDAVPDQQWEGEIALVGILPKSNEISSQLENQAVQYPVEIKITSKDMSLKPGFQLIMEIETEKKKATVIPINAVKYESNKTFVYKIDNNIAKKVEISLGISSGESIEVINGLKTGDKFIKNPSDKIKDGMEVTIE